MTSINFEALEKAFARFCQASFAIRDDIHRDGAIQRFEYTFELAWKVLQKVLQHRGVIANSPREVFRQAAKENLITDPLVWFDFLEKRNLSTHTYKEECALQIQSCFGAFEGEVKKLITLLQKSHGDGQ